MSKSVVVPVDPTEEMKKAGCEAYWSKCAGKNRDAMGKAYVAMISAAPTPEVERLYYELLYAVEWKFSDETRHETALRYIRERETAEVGPAQQEQTK